MNYLSVYIRSKISEITEIDGVEEIRIFRNSTLISSHENIFQTCFYIKLFIRKECLLNEPTR